MARCPSTTWMIHTSNTSESSVARVADRIATLAKEGARPIVAGLPDLTPRC